jgi:tetratricopeptide (TPR) repeat protein
MGFPIPEGYHFSDVSAWAKRGAELAPNDGYCQIMALSAATFGGELEVDVDYSLQRALRLSPYDPRVLVWSGWSYVFAGLPDQAMDCFTKLSNFSQQEEFIVNALPAGCAIACVQLGRDEAAVTWAKRALTVSSENPGALRPLISALAHLDRMDEAHEALTRLLAITPGDTVEALYDRSPYKDVPTVQRYADGLRKAGLPE